VACRPLAGVRKHLIDELIKLVSRQKR